MKKKSWVLLILMMLVSGCALEAAKLPEGQPKPVPVIIQSYASKQIRSGETWKIYVHASDQEGRMAQIVVMIEQPDQVYPISRTRIREKNSKELSGYYFLHTPFLDTYDQLKLILEIQDKSGAYSVPVEFFLTVCPKCVQQHPPPGMFAEQDLGPIMFLGITD